MAAIKLIILLLPVFVLSEIRVTIFGSQNEPVTVRLSGSHEGYLTSADREAFQIQSDELKQGIHLLSGTRPYYVEVGSPYRNEMHSTNSWEIVRRKVVPIRSTIIRKEIQEVHFDSGDRSTYYDLMISNDWQGPLQFMIGDDIYYDFSLAQGNSNINYKYRSANYVGKFAKDGWWGSGIRTGEGISRIRGNQLYAKKLVLEIEIKYKLSVHGYVACKFDTEVNGSYHWAYGVKSCLKAAHRPTKKYAREVIRVAFFYDEEFRA